jgi:dolichol-phosphate mannosyltransferase
MHREVPQYRAVVLREQVKPFAAIVCAWNEGARLHRQLAAMGPHASSLFDIVIADGPSTDGSTQAEVLRPLGVKAVIVLEETGGLSAALRAALAYALDSGYRGVVTLDGNNKDDTSSLAGFAARLEEGFDYVQGSRYMPGGQEINTPWSRHFLIKFVHAPLFSALCWRRFTDTTNGFRGLSRRFLLDERVNIFRKVFSAYELPYYLAWAACRYGFRTTEIPVTRSYPAGPVPTKIIGVRGYLRMLKPLVMLGLRRY